MIASFRHQAVLLLGLVAALAVPSSSGSTIVNSAHDFSALHPGGQICIFCHTTHNADLTVPDAPLWNHQVTTKTYQLYNSPTMDATMAQPGGSSRLCLSCHDGTVAIDAYGGDPGTVALTMGGDVAVGAGPEDLTDDHPVSFVYDDTLANLDGELHAPSSTPSGLGSTIDDDLLIAGRLECASCHDVHNSGAAAAVNDHLLMITQVDSQLCLTCHDK